MVAADRRREDVTGMREAGSGLRLDPDADRPGMQDWLQDLGQRDGLAATNVLFLPPLRP